MKRLTQQEMRATRYRVAKYIHNNVKENHYPGFLEIKKRFKIGLHTYFKNIAQAYKLAGLKYKRSNFWTDRRLKKEKIVRKDIINLIRLEGEKGKQLARREIESRFKIGIINYFKSLREAYRYAGVKFEPHFGPRTKEERKQTKQAVLSYVKEKVKNERYFPDIHEIRREFNIGTETYFPGGIKEIIKKAGLGKEKFSAFWRLEKERRLLKIAQYILGQRGYKIISKQNKIGPDMVVKKNGNFIPIELKAFRKNSYLPARLIPRNPISQISTYIRELKGPFGIIITTAEDLQPRYKNKVPKNVKIWFHKDIIKTIPPKSDLGEDLEFIASTFPNFNSETVIRKMRQEVIQYIKMYAKQNKYPITREIQKKFKINLHSYFKDIFEAYKLAGVKYPGHKKRMSGRKATKAEKEKIRAEMVSFVKNRSKENLPCGYNVIQRELRVAIPSYFSSMQEIYKKAEVLT